MKMRRMHASILAFALMAAISGGCSHRQAAPAARPSAVSAEERIQFLFTADVHYGYETEFSGQEHVDAHVVNQAMLQAVNRLGSVGVPADGGVGANRPAGAIDFVVVGGDIASRTVGGVQSSSASWNEFLSGFVDGLAVTGRDGRPASVFVMPGNHDVSNAIGFWRPMGAVDATAMAGIYNLMLHPDLVRTKETYNYAKDKVHTSRNIGGIHFVFLHVWPDSSERAWLESDLRHVDSAIPVILFAHDPPNAPARHFTNQNGDRGINDRDKFENVLVDSLPAGTASDGSSATEQRKLVDFLKAHNNVMAYFHGHTHFGEFCVYEGPDSDAMLALPTFGVDSPMKGHNSKERDPSLSFQLASIDPRLKQMTVREVQWNADPVAWREACTLDLTPPRSAVREDRCRMAARPRCPTEHATEP